MRKLVLAFVAITMLLTHACTHPPPRAESSEPLISWGIAASVLQEFPDIVQRLESNEYDVRAQIAVQLGVKRPVGAAKILVKLLRKEALRPRYDDTVDVLPLVVQAVSKTGKAAVEPLIDALKDKNEDLRAAVAEALGMIGDRGAVEPLIEALRDEAWFVRYKAAVALGEITDQRAVEPLTKALEHDNWDVCEGAAEALGKIRDKRAVEPLIKILSLQDSAVREADKREGLLKECKDFEPRQKAAIALGLIGGERAVKPLILALRNEDLYLQECAVEGLVTIGKTAVQPLLEALKDRREHVRACAAWALGRIGDEKAVAPLIQALKDEYEDVRGSAARALKNITKQDFDEDYEKWRQWYDKNQR